MNDLIQIEKLPVETLAEMANEAAAACEASGRKTVEHAIRCGRALLAIRPQIPHGEWLDWLKDHFDHSRQLASQYMEIANCQRASNLEDATSVRHAMRLIAATPEKQAKKQEREAKKQERQPEKAGAAAKPLAPATPVPQPQRPVVETITEADTFHLSVAAQVAKPAWLADPDELDRPEEDDLLPLPKTNTHHTAENRRQPDARETDRIGIVPPDDPRDLQDGRLYIWDEPANRLFLATPEEVWKAAMDLRTHALVADSGATILEPQAAKTAVESSRDAIPVVDAKPGKMPTVTQLRSLVEQRADIGTNRRLWSEAMVKGVQEWASYKQSLTGKAKVRSLEQWSVALTRIENVVAAQGWPAVADMIEKAIANGWQGWEHDTTGGGRKPAAVAPHRTFTRLSQAEVKYDELPE